MTLICKCGHEEKFQAKEDRADYYKAGWVIYGFSLNANAHNWICKKCVSKLSDGVKKVLNIK